GQIQLRVAEALCVLPFFTPAAVPGLFIGCLIANIFGSTLGLMDIIVGSLASLAAAFLASKIKNKWLVPLPSVILNAFLVGWVLNTMLGLPYFINVLYVGVGQALACYAIGMPLLFILDKYKNRIFKRL
ncbi:MAG: QueT transporter family protein, partial [Christensenella sp.]